MYHRVNTLCLNLRSVPQRPTALKVHQFIHDKIKLKVDQVEAIQYDYLRGVVFIQVIHEDLVAKILDQHPDHLQFRHENGKDYAVELSGNEGLVTVRIHHVPINVPNAVIVAALGIYGTMSGNARNEVWNSELPYPVYTGVRAVRMKLKKSIPSFIDIAGYRTLITYPGQQRTCMSCGDTSHFRAECTRKTVRPAVPNARTTLADIVANRFAPQQQPEFTSLPVPPPRESQPITPVEVAETTDTAGRSFGI